MNTRDELYSTATIALMAGVMLAIPFSCLLAQAAVQMMGHPTRVRVKGARPPALALG